MANGDTVIYGADGADLMDTDGADKVSGDTIDGCCCEPEVSCCECFTCCFSDDSVAEVTYDLDTILVSTGADFDNDFLDGTESNIPFASCGASARWHQALIPVNQIFVSRNCSTGGWGGGMPGPGESLQALEDQGLDVYRIELNADPGLGDCCGVTDTVAAITIDHYQRAAVEDEWPEESIATRAGTGTLTVSITNNNCCLDGEDCVPGSAVDCDGECEEELP